MQPAIVFVGGSKRVVGSNMKRSPRYAPLSMCRANQFKFHGAPKKLARHPGSGFCAALRGDPLNGPSTETLRTMFSHCMRPTPHYGPATKSFLGSFSPPLIGRWA